jgi:hypothetical protein
VSNLICTKCERTCDAVDTAAGRRSSCCDNWVFDKNDPSDEWPAPADGILAISPKLLKKLRGEI